MAAVVSVGIHGWQFVLSRRVGSRGAAHRCVGSFALASTQGSAAGAVVRERRAAIGRFVDSVMAACVACVGAPKNGIEKIV